MKRFLLVVGLILAMALAFSACGGNEPAATPGQTPAAGTPAAPDAPAAPDTPAGPAPVVLTVALWQYTIQAEFQNTLRAFTERYPHITFDIIDAVNANFEEVLVTQLAGGRAID